MNGLPRGKQIVTLTLGISALGTFWLGYLVYGAIIPIAMAIVALVFANQGARVNDTSRMVKVGKILSIIALIASGSF